MSGVDRVVHLAALAINKSVAAPTESFDVNLMGTQHVAEAACEAGVARFVFASSASVYGDPKKLPMSETDEADPRTPYCISKLAGERLLGFFEETRRPVVDGLAVLQRVRARSANRRVLHIGGPHLLAPHRQR